MRGQRPRQLQEFLGVWQLPGLGEKTPTIPLERDLTQATRGGGRGGSLPGTHTLTFSFCIQRVEPCTHHECPKGQLWPHVAPVGAWSMDLEKTGKVQNREYGDDIVITLGSDGSWTHRDITLWDVQMSTYSAFRLKLTDYGMSPVKEKFKERPKPKLLSSGAFSSAVTCSLSTFTPVFGL